MSDRGQATVAYLSGGVGGARLAHGLHQLIGPDRLRCIINTGDDLVHWGLHVSPDVDTMLYTLADVADVERGWGLAGETFAALEWVKRYGGPDWFALGDRDLATHLMRTEWLRSGLSLTEVTQRLRSRLGIATPLLPMSDDRCETMIDTDQGTLGFQPWLVGARGVPAVRKVWFRGDARPTREVLDVLEHARLIIIGPSNPYVSVEPILALPGVRERVQAKPVLAVSPIVHGRAVKGPLAGMLETLGGLSPSAASIARHYGSLLHAYVVERGDEAAITGLPVLATRTVMDTRAASRVLAARIMDFAEHSGLWS
ncbi:MAG: 2-phospho-L-lactate transferase [Polyangiales bacterium]